MGWFNFLLKIPQMTQRDDLRIAHEVAIQLAVSWRIWHPSYPGIETVVVNLWRYWGCLNDPFDISITGIVFESLHFTECALINSNRYRWKKTICPVGCDKNEEQPNWFFCCCCLTIPVRIKTALPCMRMSMHTKPPYGEHQILVRSRQTPSSVAYVSLVLFLRLYHINHGLFIVRLFSYEVLFIILLENFYYKRRIILLDY